MNNKTNLFSRAAVDKLRAPEKLDMLLPVTSPIGWMGLVAVAMLIISVVIWSIFGSFTVKVDGVGLIMDSGGLANISHMMGGKVAHLYVHSGSRVKAGDVIARLEQSELSADTQMAQHGTQLAESLRDTMGKAYQYKSKMYRQEISQDVISNHNGVITQVLAQEGSVVESGEPIASVRLTQKRRDLTGVLYVPMDKGKGVEVGQTIQLVPGNLNVWESGSLVGVVRSVSEYPVPLRYVEHRLANKELAQWIFDREGAVLEVTFALVRDDSSRTGYLWTSPVGEEHKPISAGNFVTGSVIIERNPPIERLFYGISHWLRSR